MAASLSLPMKGAQLVCQGQAGAVHPEKQAGFRLLG